MTAPAKIALLGREFEIAPYGIGAMRRAAPIIDRINAAIRRTAGLPEGEQPTVEEMVDLLALLAQFVGIGLAKVDASLTTEKLEDDLGLPDLPALQTAFRAILIASGLTAGEAKAPLPDQAAGA